MNRNRYTPKRPLWATLSVAALLALGNNVWAADTSAKPGDMAPEKQSMDSTEAKPVLPSRSELPDSAFKKLDPTGKGYVLKEDIKGLKGFEPIFDKVDAKRTGKLDQAQFKKAWNQYASEKTPDTGKAAY